MSVLLCASPAGAGAAPADRPASLEAYLQLLDTAKMPAGWTGAVETCTVGGESASSVDATARAVNILRDFAGVAPIRFDADLNRRALGAALMMRAAGRLSHQPGPDWPCYSAEGEDGAQNSNLFLGLSGPAAMVGYVDDAGVSSLGHRRWLLDPAATAFGTGSTGTTNALYVAGPRGGPPVPEVVAWPPAGHVPWPLVFEDWSASISTAGAVDLSQVVVAVSVDGSPRAASGLRVLPDGFGTGRTLAWRVATTDADRAGDRRVEVRVDGVSVDGVPRSYAYGTDAFAVLPPLAPKVTGSRTAGVLTVSWEPAVERGVPVTGYEVFATDGATELRRTLGPQDRRLDVPFGGNRPLSVRVIALSRVGNSAGYPLELAPPAAFRRSSARLRVTSIYLVGRRLVVRAQLSRAANRRQLRIRVRGGGRSHVRSTRVSSGRANINVMLPRHLSRTRPLHVTVTFSGTTALAPASKTYIFGR